MNPKRMQLFSCMSLDFRDRSFIFTWFSNMANANQTASLYYYALNSFMHFKPIFHNKSAYFLLELSRNAMHLLSVLIRVLPLLTPNLHHYFDFQQITLRRSFVNIPEHVCVCVYIMAWCACYSLQTKKNSSVEKVKIVSQAISSI